MRERLTVAARLLALCLTGNLALRTAAASQPVSDDLGTFSIVAWDSATGELGVAVHSKSLAVGSAVPFATPGIGAVATQARSNLSYGPDGISLLQSGVPVEQVVDSLTSKDPSPEIRQLGIVDAHGRAACHTGAGCSEWAGHIVGHHYAVQGNILASEQVAKNMASAFEAAGGTLAERLLAALEAGQSAGGDRRGQQSAALLVVREGAPGFVDLRVDDHEQPIVELGRIYRLREQGSLWSFRCHFGKELLDSGRAAEAEREFGKAVAIADRYPEDVQVQNGVAWELAGSSTMLDAALRFGRRAVEILPDNGSIWDTLGAVYFKRGEMKEAIEAQTRAVALSPDNDEFKQKLEEWKAESGNR